MDKVIYDVRVYANDVVDRLIALKDMNRDKLSRSEIETLNDAANLIYHNIKEIVKARELTMFFSPLYDQF